MKILRAAGVAAIALAVVFLMFLVREQGRRIDVLEQRLAAPPSVTAEPLAAVSPDAEERARQERLYQAMQQGRRDAEYLKRRDAAESQGQRSTPR